MRLSSSTRRGFTLIEILVVVVMIGLMMRIVVPKFRISNSTKARQSADQLVRDLEIVRARALATKSISRSRSTWRGTRTPATSTPTATACWARRRPRRRRSACSGPERSTPASSSAGHRRPTCRATPAPARRRSPGTRIDFDSRGLTTPLGTKGVIYIVSTADTTAVTAVSISGAGSIQAWVYKGGAWQ